MARGGAVMNATRTMVNLAQEYLDYRRKLGSQLKIEGQQLVRFAEYADQSGHCGPITIELSLRWARMPADASPLYQARRLEVVRCFARYRAIFDSATEIPPDRLLGKAHRRICPHIFSNSQISALMKSASDLQPTDSLRPLTYRTLFGLLTSTGMRITEALRLRDEDVDLTTGTLTVAETKFYKSRLLPLHPTVCEQLSEYAGVRDVQHPLPESTTFLISHRGQSLKYSTVRTTFRKIADRLGWQSNGGRRRPRLYDLRHTFACRRLIAWYHEGVDIDHAIASLSTYLGHAKVTDTYWYLTGVPELLQIASGRFEHFATPSKLSR